MAKKTKIVGLHARPLRVRNACERNGVDARTFRSRMRLGWSEAQACAPPRAKRAQSPRTAREIALCLDHGVTDKRFSARVILGWTRHAAATTPIGEKPRKGYTGKSR